MTGFCFTLFRLVYKPHISRLTLWFFYACYGLLLVYLLFSKAWASEVSTRISLALFTRPISQSYYIGFNLLLFLPLGLLFHFLGKTFLFVGAILLVEACQFFFSLGFFDLGDILLNTSGFALGNLLGKSAIAQSFKNRIQKNDPARSFLVFILNENQK